jgi:hypothetical protein
LTSIDELRGQIEALVGGYRDYEHRVDLEECFIGETGARRVDKLIHSLRSHGFEVPDEFYESLVGLLRRERRESPS